jgi:hypothetical protein
MKIRYCIILLCLARITTSVNTCPTCVGRVSKQSAPFFSDACYKDPVHPPEKQTLLQEQENQEVSSTTQSDKEE